MDERNDIPMQAGTQAKGQYKADLCNEKLSEPSLRDRLEMRRNSLTRQLVETEEALRVIYTNPDAEKNYELIRRARA
jgi:hypothetical protein